MAGDERFPTRRFAEASDVVVVTGGSGFLGQHIVKLLHERDPTVKEIRVIDLVPYKNNLGHADVKPVKTFIGDICDPSILREVFRGANCVIHCAAHFDYGVCPDEKKLNDVNVKGTLNVVEMCIEENISRLIFSSTTEVVIGPRTTIIYRLEISTPPPKVLLTAPYAKTKLDAENLIIAANGKPLANGCGNLRTVSLRLTTLYGEQDSHYVTEMLRFCKKNLCGTVPYIASRDNRHQTTYVGNAAWTHVLAKNVLLDQDCKGVEGQAMNITDDTVVDNGFYFVKPFAEARGLRISNFRIPYSIAFIFLWFVQMVMVVLVSLKVVSRDRFRLAPFTMMRFICGMYFFQRLKANLNLHYLPIYSHEESLKNSVQFYKGIKLD